MLLVMLVERKVVMGMFCWGLGNVEYLLYLCGVDWCIGEVVEDFVGDWNDVVVDECGVFVCVSFLVF